MATAVVMPKQGQSVESCIIVDWKKQPGDLVTEGDILCEVETDKAVLEIASPVSGTVLALFFQEGDDVPVLANIAAIGEPGEDVSGLRPDGETPAPTTAQPAPALAGTPAPVAAPAVGDAPPPRAERPAVSPRASKLAASRGLDLSRLRGTGPGGRIIERDVIAAQATPSRLTPVARAMVERGGFTAPARGSGPRGRVTTRDLVVPPPQPEAGPGIPPSTEDEVETIPIQGVRKVIAERMLESLQTTAQLTLHASADARALLAYRARLKGSAEDLGLQQVTINDLILFVVSRLLPQYPSLNAVFQDSTVTRYRNVHLAFAVDTPRGLIVPVIRHANRLSLQQIAAASRRLATACLEGTVLPDELTGGTFTVSNMGHLGIESFTPILNPPQVGILGVGNVSLKPIETDGDVTFVPHLGLSLTINHQVVDGAPAARFLQALSQGIADLELLLAM